MKEVLRNWQNFRWLFDFFNIFWESWLYDIMISLGFLKTGVMNPKNLLDNH
jgi:hypothetical protein